ncbi:hypothetical protein EE612_025828, partial [Oryza sativa]
LAIGSISPGLLQAAIGAFFNCFFPDYQERIARHEAAHFFGCLFDWTTNSGIFLGHWKGAC